MPYPKIVDRIAAWNADETDRRALDKQVWVASEKIHGANRCICTDPPHVPESDEPPRFMKNVSRERALQLWLILAAGNIKAIEREP